MDILKKWVWASLFICLCTYCISQTNNAQNSNQGQIEIEDYAGLMTIQQEQSLDFYKDRIPYKIALVTVSTKSLTKNFIDSGLYLEGEKNNGENEYLIEQFYKKYVENSQHDIVFYVVIPPTNEFKLVSGYALSMNLPNRDYWMNMLNEKMVLNAVNDPDVGWQRILQKKQSDSVTKGFEYMLEEIAYKIMLHTEEDANSMYNEKTYFRISDQQMMDICITTKNIHERAESIWGEHRKFHTEDSYTLEYDDVSRRQMIRKLEKDITDYMDGLKNNFLSQDEYKTRFVSSLDPSANILHETKPYAANKLGLLLEQQKMIEAEIERQLDKRKLRQIIAEMTFLENRTDVAGLVEFNDYMDLSDIFEPQKNSGRNLIRYDLKTLGGGEVGIDGFLYVLSGSVLYQYLQIECIPNQYLKGWKARIKVLTLDGGASVNTPDIPNEDKTALKNLFQAGKSGEFLKKLRSSIGKKVGGKGPILSLIPPDTTGTVNAGYSLSPFYYPPEYFNTSRFVKGAGAGGSTTIAGKSVGYSPDGLSFIEIGDLFFYTNGWSMSTDLTNPIQVFASIIDNTGVQNQITISGLKYIDNQEAIKADGLESQARKNYATAIKVAAGLSNPGAVVQFGTTLGGFTEIDTPKPLEGKTLQDQPIKPAQKLGYIPHSVATIFFGTSSSILDDYSKEQIDKAVNYLNLVKESYPGNVPSYEADSVKIQFYGASSIRWTHVNQQEFNQIFNSTGLTGTSLEDKKNKLNDKLAQDRAEAIRQYFLQRVNSHAPNVKNKINLQIELLPNNVIKDKTNLDNVLGAFIKGYVPPPDIPSCNNSPYHRAGLLVISLPKTCREAGTGCDYPDCD